MKRLSKSEKTVRLINCAIMLTQRGGEKATKSVINVLRELGYLHNANVNFVQMVAAAHPSYETMIVELDEELSDCGFPNLLEVPEQ